MANNYLLFSEEICKLTPDEISWLKRRYEQGPLDKEDWDSYDFEIKFEPHVETRAGKYRENGTDLWILAQESGNPEHVAEFIQEFLREFRPQDVFTLTWASWCSKPRIGEFGGGALVVTAQEIKFMNTWQWVEATAGQAKKEAA